MVLGKLVTEATGAPVIDRRGPTYPQAFAEEPPYPAAAFVSLAWSSLPSRLHGSPTASRTSPSIGVGFDEMDEVRGSGSADLLEDGSLEVEIERPHGDAAMLKAERTTSSAAC